MEELELFLKLPGVSVLNTDRDTADRYSSLIKMLKKQGTPLPANDVWIAAAMEKGAKLATLDARFNHIPGIINAVLQS